MPVQTGELIPLPWDELANAYEALCEANRIGNAFAIEAARDWVENCRRQCGLVGTLLITMALEHGGLELQKTLTNVFGALAQGAWERATVARKRANQAIYDVQTLTERVKELEQLLFLTRG